MRERKAAATYLEVLSHPFGVGALRDGRPISPLYQPAQGDLQYPGIHSISHLLSRVRTERQEKTYRSDGLAQPLGDPQEDLILQDLAPHARFRLTDRAISRQVDPLGRTVSMEGRLRVVNVGFDLRGRGSCGVSTRRIMCGWSSERKGDLLGSRRVRRTLIQAAPRDSLRKSSIPCPHQYTNTAPLISPPV